MKTSAKRLLYWIPRLLCILFALFLVIFSFDVFDETEGFGQTALALFMHNLPTLFLFAVLYFTWRREWIGGIIFPVLGTLYIVLFWGRFDILAYLFISGPLFLLGILFLLNWFLRAQLRTAQHSTVTE